MQAVREERGSSGFLAALSRKALTACIAGLYQLSRSTPTADLPGMKFPPTLAKWRLFMGQDPASARVLENFDADVCLPSDAERVLGERLEQLGASLPVHDAESAWKALQQAIMQEARHCLLQGPVLPREGKFQFLFRVQRIATVHYLISREFLDYGGFTERELHSFGTLPIDRVEAFTKALSGAASSAVKLTKEPVWVADYQDCRSILPNSVELLDRLGLPQHLTESAVIGMVYARVDTNNNLHLPRAPDAAGHPQFKLEPLCTAKFGRTQPVSLATEEGLPEAIHGAASCVPIQLNLIWLS